MRRFRWGRKLERAGYPVLRSPLSSTPRRPPLALFWVAPTLPCSAFGLRASCLPQTSCSAPCSLVLALRAPRELARGRLRGEVGKALAIAHESD